MTSHPRSLFVGGAVAALALIGTLGGGLAAATAEPPSGGRSVPVAVTPDQWVLSPILAQVLGPIPPSLAVISPAPAPANPVPVATSTPVAPSPAAIAPAAPQPVSHTPVVPAVPTSPPTSSVPPSVVMSAPATTIPTPPPPVTSTGLECVVTLTDPQGNPMTYSPGPANADGTCADGTPTPYSVTTGG